MANFNKFGGGGMNMQQMMKQAQKLQEDMKRAQAELEAAEIEGVSGGGLVTVVMSGKKKILAVRIKPEAVDPDDVEMLEDLISAACHDAFNKSEELYNEKMGAYAQLM
ncbi:MAG: YbaB/EbfC family nucleoid-associated protein [Clostridiales bacterium]|jgi:DNA-binding YbaB/EbfC family protein|nr:YbaB/EbfC family nucleoid-associated protein [Clostridiales bacterium]